MKITVELDDFWVESGSEYGGVGIDEINAELKVFIKNQVVSEIWKKIESSAREQITKSAQEVIERRLTDRIEWTIDSIVEKGTLKVGREEISYSDHVAGLFNEHRQWNSVDKQVERMANEHAETLKKRYDALYANRIVMKIREQGMLKDEVAKMLLTQD